MGDTPVVQRIKSLSNGISKQAATVRYPNQVADANNVQFTVLNGAVRRPGSKHILDVSGGVTPNRSYGMHLIERDDQERYMVIYGNNVLKVIDLLTNTEATVNTVGTANGYMGIGSANSDDIRFMTIGDTTFVCNTLVATGMLDDNAINPGVMPHRLTRESTVPLVFRFAPVPWTERNFIEKEISNPTASEGVFKLTFKGEETANIDRNARATRFETGSTGDGIDQRLEELRTIGSGKVIATFGPLDKDPVLVEISPDIQTGSAAPTVSADGSTIIRASGDMLSSNSSSVIVTRGSNDRNPAPQPIISNQPIRDMAYYRGRLCLAFKDTLVFSRVDETFNFFVERPAAISDADPVILQIAGDDVASIDWVVPFQGSLLILTRQGRQYFLEDVNVFSSSTASIVPSSRYETQSVRPVALGNNLYLVGESSQFTPVFQYFFDDLAASNKAIDVSKHVQGLLPRKMQSMTGSVSSQTLAAVTKVDVTSTAMRFFKAKQSGAWANYTTWQQSSTVDGTYTDLGSTDLTPQPYDHCIINEDTENTPGIVVTLDPTFQATDENGYQSQIYEVPPTNFSGSEGTAFTPPSDPRAEIYTYRWFDVGNERQQSAWSRWTYGTSNLLDAKVLDDEVYLLRRTDFNEGSKLSIDKIPLAENLSAEEGFTKHCHIDFSYLVQSSNQRYSEPFCRFSTNSGNGVTVFEIHKNGQQVKNDLLDTIVLSSDFTDVNGNSMEGRELIIHQNDRVPGFTRVYSSYHSALADGLPTLYVNGVEQTGGDYTGGRTLVGQKFQSDVTLSRVYARVGDDIPMVQGRTQIDRLIIDHVDSGSYQVEITSKDSSQSSFVQDVTINGLETGNSSTLVGANAETTTMKLIANKPQSVKWNSYEIHGRHSTNRR